MVLKAIWVSSECHKQIKTIALNKDQTTRDFIEKLIQKEAKNGNSTYSK